MSSIGHCARIIVTSAKINFAIDVKIQFVIKCVRLSRRTNIQLIKKIKKAISRFM